MNERVEIEMQFVGRGWGIETEIDEKHACENYF
jgi:hypothetical protein